jgi:hypothetical protein
LTALKACAGKNGFAWTFRPVCLSKGETDWQVTLRHVDGAEEAVISTCPDLGLASLLGFPGLGQAAAAVPDQAGEPEKLQKLQDPEPAPSPDLEVIDLEVIEAEGQPDPDLQPAPAAEQSEPDPTTPLTDEQKAAAVEMVRVMGAEQRKAFTISFRSAFSVPREVKAVAPLIRQLQHLHFVDRFTVEAAGGLAP